MGAGKSKSNSITSNRSMEDTYSSVIDTLSTEEFEALRLYTTQEDDLTYGIINDYLRNPDMLNSEEYLNNQKALEYKQKEIDFAKGQLNLLDRALDKMTKEVQKSDVVTYRGTSVSMLPKEIREQVETLALSGDYSSLKTMLKGSKITDRGFGSTSTSREVAEEFLGSSRHPILLKIKTNTKQGVYVGNKFHNYEEKEFLIKRNSTYRVTNVTKGNSVDVEYTTYGFKHGVEKVSAIVIECKLE